MIKVGEMADGKYSQSQGSMSPMKQKVTQMTGDNNELTLDRRAIYQLVYSAPNQMATQYLTLPNTLAKVIVILTFIIPTMVTLATARQLNSTTSLDDFRESHFCWSFPPFQDRTVTLCINT